jgi:hypothetical protein
MALDPNTVARKWSRNLAGATESIREGVNRVSVAPSEKAIRQAEVYLAGIQKAVAMQTWQNGLRRVSLQDWKDAILNKGLPRIAAGAAAATDKMTQFLSEFLPYVEAGQRALESTPRGDFNQNMERARRMAEHNAQFRRRT